LDFWRGAEAMHLGKHAVSVPSIADHLCYLAIHNAVHGFDRLISLVDIAYLLARVQSHEGWEVVIRHARRYGCSVNLFLNLALATGLFALPIPPEIIGELSPSTSRARILAGIFNRDTIFSGNLSHTWRHLARLVGVDRLQDALRLVLWRLFPPTAWLAHGRKAGGMRDLHPKRGAYLLLLASRAKNVAARVLRIGRKAPLH